MSCLVGDLEEPGPGGWNCEGVRLVSRAPHELRRVSGSGDSAEEVDSLKITDEVRSDDLMIRLHNAEVREERVGVTHRQGRRAKDLMGRERLTILRAFTVRPKNKVWFCLSWAKSTKPFGGLFGQNLVTSSEHSQ